MKQIIAWMIRNGVAANLLLAFILITGMNCLFTLPQKIFPETNLGRILVSVTYLGATPAEVEEAIVQKIEEQIESIEGIQEVTSTAAESAGTVNIEFQRGVDISKKLDEVKTQIDQITSFPDEAEEVEISEITARRRVIQIAVYGDVSEKTLKELAYRIKDDLSAEPEISYVQAEGIRDYEISINVSKNTLRAYNLTLQEIASIVRRNSLDLAGGDIETNYEEILLRTKGRNYNRQEFENIVLLTSPSGAKVRLGDIADIDDGFRDVVLSTRFKGKPAAYVNVYSIGEDQILKIQEIVRDYLKNELAPTLPPGVEYGIWLNEAKELQNRINLLLKNGSIGLLLVITTLTLFLDLRLAFWTSFGIFVSFIGTFAVMKMTGSSINQLSLFGFILAIGIVVDDAIVTGENIFSERERGTPPMQAAIKGAQRIAKPVIFAVLTTIVAFVPLTVVSGSLGQLLGAIPTTVIFILSLSLLESLLILPNHLSHLEAVHPRVTNRVMLFVAAVQKRVDAGLQKFVHGPLDKSLRFVTRHYVVTIVSGFTMIILAAGFIAGGFVKFTFFPEVDGNFVTVNTELEPGSTKEATKTVADYIYQQGLVVAGEIQREQGDGALYPVDGTLNLLGIRAVNGPPGTTSIQSEQSHIASIVFELIDPELRNFASRDFEQRWREKVGNIPDVNKLSFSSSLVNLGEPIQIEISARDETSLKLALKQVRRDLSQVAGVFDIRDDRDAGKQELKLSLKPRARNFGLELEDLAQQLRSAFFGAEAVRVQRGREEVRVYARLPENERNAISDLKDYRIRTPSGAFIPFSEVAEITYGKSPTTILRRDGRRIITITADVDDAVVTGQDVSSYLREQTLLKLEQTIPGFKYSFAGEQREQGRTMPEIIRNFGFALFVIYTLLAIAFRSYLQPLVIMSAIPFGLIGAILGHYIMGKSLSLLSIFGIVGLSGVVINGALVMIDFINEELSNGKPLHEAIIDGAKGRFRPIMLTSVTTFLGVSPLILERSFNAQFLIPVAISIGFGVLFATVILMLLVPALMMIPVFSPAMERIIHLQHRGGNALPDIES